MWIAGSRAVLLCCLLSIPARAADNDLFVASFSSQNVTRIDATTGAIAYSVPQGVSTIGPAFGLVPLSDCTAKGSPRPCG